MKNALLISNIRRIKSSKKRFLSLLLMSLLGVGFFVGIKATSPDMLNTLDNYLDEQNVYDIEIISTMGLTDNDIKAIDDLKIAEKIVGTKSVDKIVDLNDEEKIIKVSAINEINEVILKQGRMPKDNNEIVVESLLLKENDLKIGDTIIINDENLKAQEFKIVGVIESPLYFSDYRGTTTIGDGELDYYTYVNKETFTTDYYTSLYMILNDTKELTTNSDTYLDIISTSTKKIEDIKLARENERYKELYQEQIDYMKSLGVEVDESKFSKPVWYIFDRTDNQGYQTFTDATESLKQLGSVFPLVFYIVAVLISLISMTRMVDEDRTEIGTLKGLGFSNFHIISKYVMYSFLSTTIGGILGMLIGFNLIPRVIWSIYKSLFTIPKFICEFNMYYATIGLLIALLCICGATIITAITTLKEKPSNLMRPKAPKVGKRILLEKITFFWNKLKFSSKITIRNIFRYKKRILVTIIGIAGSTSLILVAFGLRDSVNNVVEYNYNNVFIYDETIALKTGANYDDIKELLKKNKDITSFVPISSETVKLYNTDKEDKEVNLIVPENENELTNVIKLNDLNNEKKEILIPNGQVVLSEKLAKTLDIKVHDKVSFMVKDEYKDIEVGYIVENYVNDYAYMNLNTYENIFGDYQSNVILLKTNDNYDTDFDKQIMELDSISNVISTDIAYRLMKDILSSLNSVVVILIVASAILAFIILYNLSNINISERKREISTLKVLGFYDEEVDAYITRENYFTTIIGIAIGLYFGLYLSHYIISTCEPQNIMFIRHIEIPSYIISGIISLVFTIIVNKITHYNLKKIDMVESLKSNE